VARGAPAPPLLQSEGTSTDINTLAIIPSADGTAPRIVTGPYEENQPIDVWDSDTGVLTHSLTGHEGDVRALVAFELEPGHGHVRLASAHGMEGGGMLVLWAVDEDFRQLATVHAHRGGVTSLLLLDKGVPEGEGRPRLVSAGGDATVKVRCPLEESCTQSRGKSLPPRPLPTVRPGQILNVPGPCTDLTPALASRCGTPLLGAPADDGRPGARHQGAFR
jgi:WD40 repeat protein